MSANPQEVPAQDQAAKIEAAVRTRYSDFAAGRSPKFAYPTGRESISRLGYPESLVAKAPRAAAERFVGVGNPFAVHTPVPGDRVLDVGCGAGFDAFIAALMVGPSGQVVGLDLTAEMVALANDAAAGWTGGRVHFQEGSVERLPFLDGSFDLVISNGVLNLAPDKDRAFHEIHRVLAQGGTFAAADLLVIDTIPKEVLADVDAWST